MGVTVALVGAKLVAVVCGGTLHLYERHGILSLLTLLYLTAAVIPWTRLLWP